MDRIDGTKGEINPYCKIIANKAERDDTIISEMEQWSIFSNVVNYIPYKRHPKDFYKLDIRDVDQERHKKI